MKMLSKDFRPNNMFINQQQYLEYEELAIKLINLRDKSLINPALTNDYKKLLQSCLITFKPLIEINLGKYLKYSNIEDIRQEGLIGLNKSIVTYQLNKSSFTWWANSYIKNAIIRQASKHTVIYIPPTKAKKYQQFQQELTEFIADPNSSPEENVILHDVLIKTNKIIDGMKALDKQAIVWHLKHQGNKKLHHICNELKLSRHELMKLIKENYKLIINYINKEA